MERDGKTLRTFGRTKGRALSPYQQALMRRVYPAIEIQDEVLAGLGGYEHIWLEIGFGGAEHLLWQAAHNPQAAILGVEPFLNGVAKAVKGVDDAELKNVRLYQGDARDVIARLPDGALSRVFVLFPDPWPKTRHNKRRLINEDFIAEIYRVLRPGGEFRFASDIIHYVDWSLTRIYGHGGFDFPAQTQKAWEVRASDWPGTRYEAKAIREGRHCHYFTFVRCGDANVHK